MYADRTSGSDVTVRALDADVARGTCREMPGTDQTILQDVGADSRVFSKAMNATIPSDTEGVKRNRSRPK
jgi:hypothetical protein